MKNHGGWISAALCAVHRQLSRAAVLILWPPCFHKSLYPAWLLRMTQGTSALHPVLSHTWAELGSDMGKPQDITIIFSKKTRSYRHHCVPVNFFCSFLGKMYEMHVAEGLTALHKPAQSMLGYSIPLVDTTGFGLHSLEPHLHGLHSGSCLWWGPRGSWHGRKSIDSQHWSSNNSPWTCVIKETNILSDRYMVVGKVKKRVKR